MIDHCVERGCIDRNGTHYHPKTDPKVIEILEQAREDRRILTIYYGKGGVPWGDEPEVGRIGRSTGSCKIPLCVPRGKDGGPGLLEHCIVLIVAASRSFGKGHVLYIGEGEKD